jgi:hypothetical protein
MPGVRFVKQGRPLTSGPSIAEVGCNAVFAEQVLTRDVWQHATNVYCQGAHQSEGGALLYIDGA